MKKRTLILGLLICIMAISVFLISNYDNRSYKKNNNEEKTFKTELALYLIDENGNEAKTTSYPSSNDYYADLVKSYCVNGSELSWDSTNKKVVLTANKADKCKVYFRKKTKFNLKSAIIANNTVSEATPDFSVISTSSSAELYKAADDYGTSYYFRGAPTNNYVKFGTYAANTTVNGTTYSNETPLYWRIVRINGDGTVRLIYDGTSAVANGVSHTASIGNTSYDNSTSMERVGYTYTSNSTQKDTLIKGIVDTWYDNNLETKYGKYIADSIFCNPKKVTSAVEGIQYFEAYDRLITNKSPKLSCTQDSDKYTVSDAIGNQYLSNPVGLITADEVAMAGGVNNTANNKFYLYSGSAYYTMTPYNYSGGYAYMWYVQSGGQINSVYVYGYGYGDSHGVRPVINIKADILFKGSGTKDSPYELAE